MKYTIKKGHHYARPMFTKPISLKNNVMMFQVKFSKECFDTEINEIGAVNKLFGWTQGLTSGVHVNSFRLGWALEDSHTIRLYSYEYKNGVLFKSKINVTINNYEGESYFIFIEIHESDGSPEFDEVHISCAGHSTYMQEDEFYIKKHKVKYGWWLSPFFGGELPSPNKFNITVKQIKL